MSGPAKKRLSHWLTRAPVLALGLLMAASAFQASCGGNVHETFDASGDSPSDDSPSNRADGMSYGDAYGK